MGLTRIRSAGLRIQRVAGAGSVLIGPISTGTGLFEATGNGYVPI